MKRAATSAYSKPASSAARASSTFDAKSHGVSSTELEHEAAEVVAQYA